jgi:hypothetical protein
MESKDVVIPLSYDAYGYHYKLNKSERIADSNSGVVQYKALYSSSVEGMSRLLYEVVIIRITKGNEFLRENTEKFYARLPSPSKWGLFGWSPTSLRKADDKYESLN